MEEARTPKYVGSVIKAVEILECIAAAPDGLGVTEISKELDYGVSATYHMLNTLKHTHMIEQDPHTKKYRIGINIFKISNEASKQNLLGSLTLPYLDRLSTLMQETSSLAMLDGINLICVAQSEGQRMLRLFSRPGQQSPFYYTAGGKLLISLKPRSDWDVFINRIRFEKYTGNTITSVDALIEELELTRKRGYGLDNEERESDVFCIAVPVFNCHGEAIAAMSISALASRMKMQNIDEVVRRMKTVALELSSKIGYEIKD